MFGYGMCAFSSVIPTNQKILLTVLIVCRDILEIVIRVSSSLFSFHEPNSVVGGSRKIEMPPYDDLKSATLDAIRGLGGTASNKEIVQRVIEDMNLPSRITEILHTNGRDTALEYHLAWARTKLKNEGLIYNSGRAMWSLTELRYGIESADPDKTSLSYSNVAPEHGSQLHTEKQVDEGTMPNNETVINSLKAEIQQLEEKKRTIDNNIQALLTTLRYFEGEDVSPQSQPAPPPQKNKSAPTIIIRNTIYEILNTQGPLHRSDIYQYLVQRGVHISGKYPVDNVGVHLSSDSRFESLGNGIWGVANLSNYGVDVGIEEESDEEMDVPW